MKNRSFLYKISALLIFCMAVFVSCNEDLVEDKENTDAPVITDFYPKSGKAGTEVTIKGENLLKVDTAYIGMGWQG